MTVEILPGAARGEAAAPPSKSFAHRMLMCAALCRGVSRVRGIADSEDMRATLDCLSALGAKWDMRQGEATITGAPFPFPEDALFPCRESGSTLRFFLPLPAVSGVSARFTGTSRLMERGVGEYERIFGDKGVSLIREDGGLRVRGQLPAGLYTVRGDISSQFITGLLFALPLASGDSVVRVLPPVESRAYIRITQETLRACGIWIEEKGNDFYVPGGQTYLPRTAEVEGDWSNAAFLLAWNRLGGNVHVTGLRPDSVQGDRMCLSLFDCLDAGEEIDLSDCPDLGPVLFAIAAAGRGGRFIGTARLRIKESDRAAVMAQELGKMGIRVHVEENRVTVEKGTLQPPRASLDGHNDHRVVMALSLLAARTGGRIEGAEAVRKSWPEYFETLQALGVKVRYEN